MEEIQISCCLTCVFLRSLCYCEIYEKNVSVQMIQQHDKPSYCEVVGARAIKKAVEVDRLWSQLRNHPFYPSVHHPFRPRLCPGKGSRAHSDPPSLDSPHVCLFDFKIQADRCRNCTQENRSFDFFLRCYRLNLFYC